MEIKSYSNTGIGVFTIVDVQSGQGSDTGWGKLKSGAGWISLDYTKKLQPTFWACGRNPAGPLFLFLPAQIGFQSPVESEGQAFGLEVNMTNEQRIKITNLRHQGYGYTAIANAVGLSKDSVKAYCRNHGLAGEVAAAHTLAEVSPDGCLNCGAPIIQRPKVKKRKFCCSDCRISWYKANPDRLNLKAMYEYVCPTCGKHFSAYGNSRRKYCSHACYIAGRFRGGDGA